MKRSAKRTNWLPSAQDLHFDIDVYLNRLVAPSRLHRLPYPVGKFLGYRRETKPEIGNILIAFWACVGSIAGLLIVGSIFKYAPGVKDLNPPVIFASFGATAILEYNVIHSPLSSPRNALFGHTSSVLVGVGISKLLQLSDNFIELRWVGAALACGASSIVMTMTNTVHPPGGATAVLAVIEPSVVALGWWFVPLIILGSVLMLVVGLITNNVQRQFPAYWWTPKDVRRSRPRDVEVALQGDIEKPSTERTTLPAAEQTNLTQHLDTNNYLILGPTGYVLPRDITLTVEESKLMFALQERLRARNCPGHRTSSDTSLSEDDTCKDTASVKDDESMSSR